jgi:hypothetical protein
MLSHPLLHFFAASRLFARILRPEGGIMCLDVTLSIGSIPSIHRPPDEAKVVLSMTVAIEELANDHCQ